VILLAAVLPLRELTPQRALEVVAFIQQMNFAAYLSHRKSTLKKLEERFDGL
jgi:hypothetical protein